MPLHIGYIDSDGHPKIKLRVSGTNPDSSAVIEAMIDTGFTGFLMLPIAIALPLGLILTGTGDYSLADGTTITNYIAWGKITIGESAGVVPFQEDHSHEAEEIEGSIALCGESALVGMDFLRGLKKLLIVGEVVILMEHSDLAATLNAAKASIPNL